MKQVGGKSLSSVPDTLQQSWDEIEWIEVKWSEKLADTGNRRKMCKIWLYLLTVWNEIESESTGETLRILWLWQWSLWRQRIWTLHNCRIHGVSWKGPLFVFFIIHKMLQQSPWRSSKVDDFNLVWKGVCHLL